MNPAREVVSSEVLGQISPSVLLTPFIVEESYLSDNFPQLREWLEGTSEASSEEVATIDLDDPNLTAWRMMSTALGRLVSQKPARDPSFEASQLLRDIRIDTFRDSLVVRELVRSAVDFADVYTDFKQRSQATTNEAKRIAGGDDRLRYYLLKQIANVQINPETADRDVDTPRTTFVLMAGLDEGYKRSRSLAGTVLRELEKGIFDTYIVEDIIEFIISHGSRGNKIFTEINVLLDQVIAENGEAILQNVPGIAELLYKEHRHLFMKARQRLLRAAQTAINNSVSALRDAGFTPSRSGGLEEVAYHINCFNRRQMVLADRAAHDLTPVQPQRSSKPNIRKSSRDVRIVPEPRESGSANNETAEKSKELVFLSASHKRIYSRESPEFQKRLDSFLSRNKVHKTDSDRLEVILDQLAKQESTQDYGGITNYRGSTITINQKRYQLMQFKPKASSTLEGFSLLDERVRVWYIRLGNKIAILRIFERKNDVAVARGLGIATKHAD